MNRVPLLNMNKLGNLFSVSNCKCIPIPILTNSIHELNINSLKWEKYLIRYSLNNIQLPTNEFYTICLGIMESVIQSIWWKDYRNINWQIVIQNVELLSVFKIILYQILPKWGRRLVSDADVNASYITIRQTSTILYFKKKQRIYKNCSQQRKIPAACHAINTEVKK